MARSVTVLNRIFSSRFTSNDCFCSEVVFGVVGYGLRKLDIPQVPVILGILLGNEMEKNLRSALTISDGNRDILWARGFPSACGPSRRS